MEIKVNDGNTEIVCDAPTPPMALKVMALGMAVPRKLVIDVAVITPPMCRPHQAVEWELEAVHAEAANPKGMLPLTDPGILTGFMICPAIPTLLNPKVDDPAVLFRANIAIQY